MSVEHFLLNTLRDLDKLQPEEDRVEITRAGGLVRARFAGKKDSVFGTTPSEAAQRLKRLERLGLRGVLCNQL
jgi:hypothetical protein